MIKFYQFYGKIRSDFSQNLFLKLSRPKFNIVQQETREEKTIDLLADQLKSKDDQIQEKDRQLEKKDEQIAQLLERQREQNILTKTLQDKVLALEPGDRKSDKPVVDHEEKTAEKKGFWKKMFG